MQIFSSSLLSFPPASHSQTLKFVPYSRSNIPLSPEAAAHFISCPASRMAWGARVDVSRLSRAAPTSLQRSYLPEMVSSSFINHMASWVWAVLRSPCVPHCPQIKSVSCLRKGGKRFPKTEHLGGLSQAESLEIEASPTVTRLNTAPWSCFRRPDLLAPYSCILWGKVKTSPKPRTLLRFSQGHSFPHYSQKVFFFPGPSKICLVRCFVGWLVLLFASWPYFKSLWVTHFEFASLTALLEDHSSFQLSALLMHNTRLSFMLSSFQQHPAEGLCLALGFSLLRSLFLARWSWEIEI